MSGFENVDTGVLVNILAQHTEKLTKLFLRVTMSKEYEEHKRQVDAISEELNRRKQELKILQSSYGPRNPYGQTNRSGDIGFD